MTSGARPRVVLGVSGGIAAYKACELLRRFTESGHDVTVVPTAAALEFVGAATWAALSGKPVAAEVWADVHEVPARPDRPGGRPGRRRPGDRRPAGQGRPRARRRPAHQHPADRPLPGRLRARDAHRDVGAPRHPGQRRHPALPRRRRDRARRGPADRRRHRQGPAARAGRDLRARARACFARGVDRSLDLAGRHVVVSAGGTREYLDPVRFLGNRSSGLQGYALARAAAARGAEVTLVSANVACPTRPASRWSGSRPPASCATPWSSAAAVGRRRRDGRGPGRLPPDHGQRQQDQEGRRRLAPRPSS